MTDTTPMEIVIELKMIRTTFFGAILIIEGKNDEKIYGRFVDNSTCLTHPVSGKKEVVEIINILDASGQKGMLGIVDADFWHLDSITSPSNNLLVTDEHDSEMMLINSGSFAQIIDEYGSIKKITEYENKYGGKKLRDIILELAIPIGVLRYISHTEDLNLKFNGIDYGKIVDRDTLEINKSMMVRNVLANTKDHTLNDSEVLKKLNEKLDKNTYNSKQVNCGHDITKIIGIGLRKTLGSCDSKIAHGKNIESIMRLAYEIQYFVTLKLYASIRNWERKNAYKVLEAA